MSFRSRHHIIFTSSDWSSRPEAKAIREHPSLIKKLSWEEHQEIHRNVPAIPLLGYHALRRVLKDYEPQQTVSGSIESLMSVIELAAQHPRSHDIESQLALLAVDALDLQRPYILNAELTEQRSIIL